MTGRSFVDTNVLAYAFDRNNIVKRDLARPLIAGLLAERLLVISAQVLNELASTLMKPAFGLGLDETRRALCVLEGATIIDMDLPLSLRALDVKSRYGISSWDGLIVAAAERAHCREILSEDLNHGQEYFGIAVRNPFLNAVSES